MDRNDLNERLPAVVDALVESVVAEPRMQHLNRIYMPDRDKVIEAIKKLRQVIFPGYFGKQGLSRQNVRFRIGELVMDVSDLLFDQVRCGLRYREQIPGTNGGNQKKIDDEAAEVLGRFLERIPEVRRILSTDVEAAFEGDPAAKSTDETIYCYPGVFAIMVQRLAHELHNMQVPLLPRIMTEYAHSLTGIDIHPGANLGERFFIDHGTGVVIGETTEIGRNVKVYQGVTLGALAPAFGQMLRGHKRHPTIEDDVTIYAGATILGGETVIGHGAVIGGNVFITSSVPPMNQVSAEPPKLRYRDRRPKGARSSSAVIGDFQI
jgi:serine O-acetyltransferase